LLLTTEVVRLNLAAIERVKIRFHPPVETRGVSPSHLIKYFIKNYISHLSGSSTATRSHLSHL